jgi:hypothetical protein
MTTLIAIENFHFLQMATFSTRSLLRGALRPQHQNQTGRFSTVIRDLVPISTSTHAELYDAHHQHYENYVQHRHWYRRRHVAHWLPP